MAENTMTMHRAIVHLRDRIERIEAMETKRRPHWSQDDLASVTRLLERNASDEVVALARIEGIASFRNYEASDKLNRIVGIARRGLGFS